MNEKNDDARFTIRDVDEAPNSLYIADAENLRIEKLSTRITLIAVLIPCLLVIVLAIAYLDIKTRVVSTQNTGSMGVQNLSKDLDSRFSSLSLKQAKIEQQLSETSRSLETATAALQINLKKATAELKRTVDGKSDRSTLTTLSKKTDATIATMQKEMADLNTALAKFDDELTGMIQIMAEGLKKDQGRLAKIEEKTRQLDTEKLNKASMELTLGLERLALQEMVKDRIREVGKKLAAMDKRLDTLNQRLDVQIRSNASPPTPKTSTQPESPPQPTASPLPSGAADIVEQTIN